MIAIILIYLISFAINLLIEYVDDKHRIHNIGDLIDNIEPYMCYPVINTLLVLLYIVGTIFMIICALSKLDILWQKFRNIKLK